MSAQPDQPSFDDGPQQVESVKSTFSAARVVMPAAAGVVLSGELDIATVPIAEQELRQAQDEARHVLLDVNNLTFIDASGLRMMLEADMRARRDGGRLVVALEGAGCVRRLLELTDADHSLELADDAAASQNGSGPDRT